MEYFITKVLNTGKYFKESQNSHSHLWPAYKSNWKIFCQKSSTYTREYTVSLFCCCFIVDLTSTGSIFYSKKRTLILLYDIVLFLSFITRQLITTIRSVVAAQKRILIWFATKLGPTSLSCSTVVLSSLSLIFPFVFVQSMNEGEWGGLSYKT
jgi:hypothetical protein